MFERRAFFAKLAGLLGMSTLPVQPGGEPVGRRVRREKMAAKGLGPDDVRVEIVWDHVGDVPDARCYFDCHGETYGFMCRLDGSLEFLGVLITPESIKRITARTPRSPEKEDNKPKAPLVIDSHADYKHFRQYEVFDADTRERVLFAIFYADEGAGIIRFWTPLGNRLETYLQQDRDRGGKFEITDQGIRTYHIGSPLAWIEMRRNIRILKKMSDQERFQAQAAIT